jgi:hypothetical protein
MKALQLGVFVFMRIIAWTLVTAAFWFVVNARPAHPLLADLTAASLFFVCYALTPRMPLAERTS